MRPRMNKKRRPSGRRPVLRRALIGGLALFWGVILIALGLRWNLIRSSDRKWREAVAHADSIDPAWRWADVEAGRQQIPNSENSALFILSLKSRGLPSVWNPDMSPGFSKKQPSQLRGLRLLLPTQRIGMTTILGLGN